MSFSKEDLESYKKTAISAITALYDTAEGEKSVTRYVTHLLEEIDDDFWEEHLKTSTPEAVQILGILELVSHWSDGDAQVFEFSLPDKGTAFVLSVQFDNDGDVVDIEMDM